MRCYAYTTHPHIGDNVICTGAVRNVCAAHPDIKFVSAGACADITANNPDYVPLRDGVLYTVLPKITYGNPLEQEKTAARGSCVEAYTRSLCELLHIPMVPIVTRSPVLRLTDREKEKAKEWEGCILLNANCQRCSLSKGYPHWQKVVDMLDGCRIVQIGGNEERDLSPDLQGVEDMRGKTLLRDLIVMAYGCRGVMSPPSCITNLAGAFAKPQIVLNASREPDRLTDYPNAVHISHRSRCGWGVDTGCVHCRCGEGSRACQDYVTVGDRRWCWCQWSLPPEMVAEEARKLFA
jgi:ADP-heptose:LPS heptosyltransferase